MCMLPLILQRSPTQRSHRVQKAKGFVGFSLWKVATAVKVTVRTISYVIWLCLLRLYEFVMFFVQFPFVFHLLVLYTYISALWYAFKETLPAFVTEHCYTVYYYLHICFEFKNIYYLYELAFVCTNVYKINGILHDCSKYEIYFSCWTGYLTRSLRSLVRYYPVQHSK
jgi:hypothetical protein